MILDSEKKNGQVTCQATKLALELKIVSFPNFKRNTNYAKKIRTEPRVVFAKLNLCLFPKTIVK